MRILILVIVLQVCGCAVLPEQGSLAAIRQQAEREAVGGCVKWGLREHPHVPTADVWNGCRRTFSSAPMPTGSI